MHQDLVLSRNATSLLLSFESPSSPMQAIGAIISPSLKADDLKMGGDKWQPVQ